MSEEDFTADELAAQEVVEVFRNTVREINETYTEFHTEAIEEQRKFVKSTGFYRVFFMILFGVLTVTNVIGLVGAIIAGAVVYIGINTILTLFTGAMGYYAWHNFSSLIRLGKKRIAESERALEYANG